MAKIVMLCKAYPPVAGGVETYSHQVALSYLRSGHSVRVLTQTHGVRGWSSQESEDGVIELYNSGPGNQLMTAARLFLILRWGRMRGWGDLLHATTWRPLAAALHIRTPAVVTVHGREILANPVVVRPLMKLVLRHARSIVVVSRVTRNRAIEVAQLRGAQRWVVAPNGISFEREALEFRRRSPSASAPLRILTFARLVERKNVSGALGAVAALKNSGRTNFEYQIAGTGPLKESLEQDVKRLGLSDCVSFTGYVDEEMLPGMYQRADLFLHPQIATTGGSDFEGFGLTIADAMSFGCVAVAGIGAGPDDFISSGQTGYLVDGRAVDAIADVLKRLYDDPGMRQEVGQAAKAFVTNNLSWDRHADLVLHAAGLAK